MKSHTVGKVEKHNLRVGDEILNEGGEPLKNLICINSGYAVLMTSEKVEIVKEILGEKTEIKLTFEEVEAIYNLLKRA